MQREAKIPKFKRCKIGQPQLLILMQSFDEDPLPSFDKRQTLAKELGMTPRSVQIWFQNRRQRLLKPMRQGEHDAEEGSPQESSSGQEGSDGSSAHDSADMGNCRVHDWSSSASTLSEAGHQGHFLSRQKQHDFERQLNTQNTGQLMCGEGHANSGQVPMWLSGGNAVIGWSDDPPYPISLLPQAVAAGHVSPGTAAMLMQALQQQIDARHQRNVHGRPAQMLAAAGVPAKEQSSKAKNGTVPMPQQAHLPTDKLNAATPGVTKSSADGVDGLLLLSACADVQRQDIVDNLPWQPHFAPSTTTNACCPHSNAMIMT